MLLVIQRCVKPPGFIFSARTYRIVLNNQGLYLIHLGKAMGVSVQSGGYVADKQAGYMVNKMEAALMKQLEAREENIDNSNLDNELESKESRYFKSPSEVQLNFKRINNQKGKLNLRRR